MNTSKFIPSMVVDSTHGHMMRESIYKLLNKPGVLSFKVMGTDYPEGSNEILDDVVLSTEYDESLYSIHKVTYPLSTGIYELELFKHGDFVPHLVDSISVPDGDYVVSKRDLEFKESKYHASLSHVKDIIINVTAQNFVNCDMVDIVNDYKQKLRDRVKLFGLESRFSQYIESLSLYDFCFNIDHQESLVDFDVEPRLTSLGHLSISLKRSYDLYFKGDYVLFNPHDKYIGDVKVNTDLCKLLFADEEVLNIGGLTIDGGI